MITKKHFISLFQPAGGAPRPFDNVKEYFDGKYIPKFKGTPKGIRVREGLARANKHFANALEKLEFIINYTEGLKDYAKKVGKDYDEFTKALEVLKFYWSGYRSKIRLNFRHNVQTIRDNISKVKRLFEGKVASTYFSLSANHKDNFDPLTVTKQENAFVGGLKRTFIYNMMGPGYGTSIRLRDMNDFFNKSLEKDWKSYTKLIRQIREQLAFCKAGTLNWLENIVRLNEGLHLEMLKKSSEKVLADKLWKEIYNKEIETVLGNSSKVKLIGKDLSKEVDLSPKPQRNGVDVDTMKFQLIPLNFSDVFTKIKTANPEIKEIKDLTSLFPIVKNGLWLSKDLKSLDINVKKAKVFRIAIFNSAARDKLLEKIYNKGFAGAVKDKPVLMLLSNDLEKTGGGDPKEIEDTLKGYLANYETLIE